MHGCARFDQASKFNPDGDTFKATIKAMLRDPNDVEPEPEQRTATAQNQSPSLAGSDVEMGTLTGAGSGGGGSGSATSSAASSPGSGVRVLALSPLELGSSAGGAKGDGKGLDGSGGFDSSSSSGSPETSPDSPHRRMNDISPFTTAGEKTTLSQRSSNGSSSVGLVARAPTRLQLAGLKTRGNGGHGHGHGGAGAAAAAEEPVRLQATSQHELHMQVRSARLIRGCCGSGCLLVWLCCTLLACVHSPRTCVLCTAAEGKRL
jgi:hypothetical protein